MAAPTKAAKAPGRPRKGSDDPDMARMTPAQLRAALGKLRKAVRKHRDARDNARCWLNDLALYAQLPERKPAGQMTLPEEVLLRNCRAYVRRQQCSLHWGSHAKHAKKKGNPRKRA